MPSETDKFLGQLGSELSSSDPSFLVFFRSLFTGGESVPDLEQICSWQKCGVCAADGANVDFGAVANAKVHYMGRAHKKTTKAWLDKWATASRRRAPALMELENMKVDLNDGTGDGEDRNPEYCKICKLVFTSQTVAVSHYAGKNHAKAKQKSLMGSPMISTTGPKPSDEIKMWEGMAAKGKEAPKAPEDKHEGYTGKSALRKYFCMPCQANFTSVFAWEEHRKSAAHVEKSGNGEAAATSTETPAAAATTEDGGTTKEGEDAAKTLEEAQKMVYDGVEKREVAGKVAFFCTLCQADCNSVQMVQSHVAGRKHQMNLAKKHGGGFGGFGRGRGGGKMRGGGVGFGNGPRFNPMGRGGGPRPPGPMGPPVGPDGGPMPMEVGMMGPPAPMGPMGPMGPMPMGPPFQCGLCNVEATSAETLQTHFVGKKHAARLNQVGGGGPGGGFGNFPGFGQGPQFPAGGFDEDWNPGNRSGFWGGWNNSRGGRGKPRNKNRSKNNKEQPKADGVKAEGADAATEVKAPAAASPMEEGKASA